MTDDQVLEVVAEETGAVDGVPRWRVATIEATILLLQIAATIVILLVVAWPIATQLNISPRAHIFELWILSALLGAAASHWRGTPERRLANTLWLTESERHVHDYDAISIPRPTEALR